MREHFLFMTFFSSMAVSLNAIAVEDCTTEKNTESAQVVVDLNQSRPISPFIFGHNIEYFEVAQGLCNSETGLIRNDVGQYLSTLKPAVLRFPGGTLAQFYHWADGIGPMEKRGKACSDWGEHKPELPMIFGTDEFFRFAKTIGTRQAMITVNMQTSIDAQPWMGTAQEAAAWVAYCNARADNKTVIGVDCKGKDWGSAADWARMRAKNGHPEPYAVRFWELGNEVYVSFDEPMLYSKFCKEYARVMKAVDPSIRIGVVAKDSDFGLVDSSWNNTLLKQTDGDVDYLITHFYLPGIDGLGECSLSAGEKAEFSITIPKSEALKVVMKAYANNSADPPRKMEISFDGKAWPLPVWTVKDFPIWEFEKKLSAGKHTIMVSNADTNSPVILREISLNGNGWKKTVEFRNTSKNDVARLTMLSPDRFRKKLMDLRSAINRHVTKKNDFGLAITEFACNLRRDWEMDPDRLALIRSQQAALYIADSLLAFQEAGIETSNYWTLRGWQWSLIELMHDKIIPQAPYFVYKLYADAWQELFCPTNVACGTIELTPMRKVEFRQPAHSALVAGASVNREKSCVAVILINRAMENQTEVAVHLKSEGFSIRSAKLTLMAAASDAVNTSATPNALGLKNVPVQLNASGSVKCVMPPCSVGMLVLDRCTNVKEGVKR